MFPRGPTVRLRMEMSQRLRPSSVIVPNAAPRIFLQCDRPDYVPEMLKK